MKLKLNILAPLTIAIIVISSVAWWQYNANQKTQLAKLKVEQERTIKVMHDAMEESRKLQLSNKSVIPEEDKALFAADQEELAQIKLWQSLPKEKRAMLLPNTDNMHSDPKSLE